MLVVLPAPNLMSVIQKLFGRDDRFFQLLEAGASEAKKSTTLLVRLVGLIGDPAVDEALGDLAESRRKHKRLAQETNEQLCEKFVTPIEREDIAALSTAIYKISKTVEKIGERLTIAPSGVKMDCIQRQVSILDQAATIMLKMVNEVRTREHGVVKDDYERLHVLESEADRLINELLGSLYRSDTEARIILFWKDVYELLEKSIDRCRDVGAEVVQIVLKNA
jgi:uncharacterized protein Yka (UPF0111/DUF47 family)